MSDNGIRVVDLEAAASLVMTQAHVIRRATGVSFGDALGCAYADVGSIIGVSGEELRTRLLALRRGQRREGRDMNKKPTNGFGVTLPDRTRIVRAEDAANRALVAHLKKNMAKLKVNESLDLEWSADKGQAKQARPLVVKVARALKWKPVLVEGYQLPRAYKAVILKPGVLRVTRYG
jgi:hypothetical protein